MKKLALIVMLLALHFATAQESTTKLTVTESEEYKDKVKANDILSIHTTESGLTGIVRNSKRDILFDIFDANLKKVFNEVVESDKKETFVGELFYDNEIKFFTVYAPKKTERIVYCHIFDIAAKTHKKVKLFETTVEKKQLLFSGQNKRQTSFAISPNGNYFAITTDNIKKNSNSYTIRVFNANNLSLLYEKAYQEHEKRFYQHNDLSIDDNATVYGLGKLFIKGRSLKRKGDANYEFVLNKVTQSGTNDITISLGEDEHIQSLNISIIQDELHLLGFYSEKNVFKIKGGCNFVIDTNALAVKRKRSYELPIEVYKDLYGENRADRKKSKGKEISNFYVDYVLQDNNGNTYILAEEFYITQTYVSTGTTGGYWVTTYHYDDILIMKFDAKGELSWGRSIFKKATAPSYNAFLKDDQLHVILNSGKRLTEKNDGRTKVSKGFLESTALFDFVYSADGKVSYDKIQDNKGNTYYTPYFGTFENNTFIMASDGRKKKQFMILK